MREEKAQETYTTLTNHKKTKSETIRYKQKDSKMNTAQTKQYEWECLKNSIEFILCWPSTTRHEAYPDIGVSIPSETPLEKTNFFSLQARTIYR